LNDADKLFKELIMDTQKNQGSQKPNKPGEQKQATPGQQKDQKQPQQTPGKKA
jgi:hypothetical protein|tara:strand:- start:130 stop:288 length:159 start_codon:yes stop_codon:yes gene_type:complete